MDKNLILNKLREHKKFTKDSEFAKFLGISASNLRNWRTRNSYDEDKLIRLFTDVNEEWILTGEGPMLKSDGTVIEGDNNSVMNINAGGDVKGNKLNPPTNVEMFMSEIAAQRKLTEKAQEQVSTAQEQMGILLELLKKQ